MECGELTPLEKICYGEIASFKTFYASNAWLAKRLATSERTARRCVAKLLELGLIEGDGYNGRFRKLKTAERRPQMATMATSGHSDWPNLATQTGHLCPPENKVENKVENSLLEVKGAKAPEKFGNELVIKAFELWQHYIGFAPKNSAENRRAAYNIMRAKDKGERWLEQSLQLLLKANEDRYSGIKIASLADLQRDWEKVYAWGSREAQNRQRLATITDDIVVAAPKNNQPEQITPNEAIKQLKKGNQ
jgi:DNA-binding Lrp family transcriptional regulator